jgi:chemotaxis signal transduction protein
MSTTATPSGSGPREETHALFAFRLGHDLFLVPAEEVVAVIATESPAPLPRVPVHVLGLVNHDHRALAVLDLARFLGRTDAAEGERPRTLVLRGGDATVGVPVTTALGVVAVGASAVRTASGVFGPQVGEVLRGECETPHGAGAWLDLVRVLEAARV